MVLDVEGGRRARNSSSGFHLRMVGEVLGVEVVFNQRPWRMESEASVPLYTRCRPGGIFVMPWKLGDESNDIRSIPTKVLGGRSTKSRVDEEVEDAMRGRDGEWFEALLSSLSTQECKVQKFVIAAIVPALMAKRYADEDQAERAVLRVFGVLAVRTCHHSTISSPCSHSQTTTTTTALASCRVRWRRRNVLNPPNLHARTSQRTQSRLSTWSGSLRAVSTSSSDLDVESSDS